MTIQKLLRSDVAKFVTLVLLAVVVFFPNAAEAGCFITVDYPDPEDHQDTGECNYWPACEQIDGTTVYPYTTVTLCVKTCSGCNSTNPPVIPVCSVGYVNCNVPNPPPTVNLNFSFLEKIQSFVSNPTHLFDGVGKSYRG